MSLRQHVYFAQAHYGGPIKIGVSYHPEHRLKTVQATLPFDLVLIGMAKGGGFAEKFLHCYFAADWIRSEWFQPSADLWRAALQARQHGEIDWVPREISGRAYFDTEVTVRLRRQVGISAEALARAARCGVPSIRAIEKRPAIDSALYLAALAACFVRQGDHWDWNSMAVAATREDVAATVDPRKPSDDLPKKFMVAA